MPTSEHLETRVQRLETALKLVCDRTTQLGFRAKTIAEAMQGYEALDFVRHELLSEANEVINYMADAVKELNHG